MDWVSGGTRYGLDGRSIDSHVHHGYRFDAAVTSQDGRYAVIYEKLGTKAALLRDGRHVRELNRSYYHANAYEYPIALLTLPSGRTLLAHCPEEYCTLELEDAETGERLTRRDSKSPDFFHSRLQFSRDGRYLLSAGWIWHPVDAASTFDVARALEQPASLDQPQDFEVGDCFLEIHSAAFGERDLLVMDCSGLDGDETPFEDGRPTDTARLGVYSLTERRFLSMAPLDRPAGTLMVMDGYAVGFFEHPRLIELATGRVVESWPGLATGMQSSSIIRHLPSLPPLALDPVGRRFAVGTDKGIEVIRFSP
ncbi:hypothetical protein [Archangium lansingense]|uniref:Lipoprotein n=1 Tax=Archangium lansingense TaxID=2995310 RepID=A0ABT3ZW61_9BACT|nr:hypothetical protein [Archangium lansinium]MCY1073613.1 hypothetical protein [Archangium lansinium]